MFRKRSNIFLLFLFLALAPTCLSASTPKGNNRFTLVLDAGHGGRDPGAQGRFSKEKHINLEIALEVGRLVEANCPDVKVVYTRKTDVFVSLNRRAEIANEAKADLFISIHTNALPGKRIAYGTETYTLGMARAEENLEVAKRENSVILIEDNYLERYAGFNPRSSESYIIFEFMQDQYMKQSVSLARMIQDQYVRVAGRRDKGVHQSGLLVLRATSMPGVLTEVGFISTPEEERYLNSQKGVRQLAQSIYKGFVNYKKSQDKAGGAARNKLVEEDTEPAKEAQRPAAAPKKAETKAEEAPQQQAATDNETATEGRPVFKVQILAADRNIREGDRQFKGLKPISSYKENNLYKFTYGESTDYAEINRIRRSIAGKFPKAFVVAFLNGERINLQEAVKAAKKQP